MTNPNLSPAAIRRQLNSILHNSELKNSAILSSFLDFIVTEKLAGRAGQIKEYTIGVQALGRSPDFNPQVDSNVRIHAGRLRRILRDYYSHEGKEDEIVITMPKGTYVPIFELESRHKGALSKSHLEGSANPLNETVLSTNLYTKPVVAVLPFYNLSSEHSKDFFVAGIGERLNTHLAKFQNISVISYFTTNKYDSSIDLEIMRKQQVDFVLTGSIRIVEESVRLSIQLILTGNGEIIWSENFVRTLSNDKIFDIQDDIIVKVLNALADDNGVILKNRARAVLQAGRQLSTIEQAIYQYFDFITDFEPSRFEATLSGLRKANRAYPDFPLISALLSGLYLDIFATNPAHDPKLLNEAIDLAQNALSGDSSCQQARKALAWAFLYKGDKERCEEEIERCIHLNSKAATTISTMALAYICLGEYKKGLRWLLETANLSDNLPICSQLGYAIYYYSTGNYKKSLLFLKRVNALKFPFFVLLQHSIDGHLATKSTWAEDSPPPGNILTETLLNRFLFDQALKKDILKGLQLRTKLTTEVTFPG